MLAESAEIPPNPGSQCFALARTAELPGYIDVLAWDKVQTHNYFDNLQLGVPDKPNTWNGRNLKISPSGGINDLDVFEEEAPGAQTVTHIQWVV